MNRLEVGQQGMFVAEDVRLVGFANWPNFFDGGKTNHTHDWKITNVLHHHDHDGVGADH